MRQLLIKGENMNISFAERFHNKEKSSFNLCMYIEYFFIPFFKVCVLNNQNTKVG
jgi:hypothetical protein